MATKWVSVTPGDYDLEDIATTVERAVSLSVENGVRVQVLRLTPSTLSARRVKAALEQSETWSKALVISTADYLYVALFHEE
jgi:hypothetical protein